MFALLLLMSILFLPLAPELLATIARTRWLRTAPELCAAVSATNVDAHDLYDALFHLLNGRHCPRPQAIRGL